MEVLVIDWREDGGAVIVGADRHHRPFLELGFGDLLFPVYEFEAVWNRIELLAHHFFTSLQDTYFTRNFCDNLNLAHR